MNHPREGLLARYAEHLPLNSKTPRISLNEGGTPLVRSTTLEHELGLGRLYFKFEGLNPTGSFKDRGMVMAVARALELGSGALVCASTGNTSASAAAYAARFGLKSVVVVPAGKIARGKLLQARIHGARVISIRGNFDRALEIVRELAGQLELTMVNSTNPDRIEGQKTAAFEIVDALGQAPDHLALPVGNAGNITAYWKGFREYAAAGHCRQLPRLLGAQAEGAAPIVNHQAVADPQTVASAIRIGNPASWEFATEARDQSGGLIESVSDQQILEAQARLASSEGLFCEPASAAPLALLARLAEEGRLEPGSSAVCVLTGNGLKDPEAALEHLGPAELAEVEPDLTAIARLLSL